MKVLRTAIEGVLIIEPQSFEDRRGYFMELYHEKRYKEAGIAGPFVQDNLSRSVGRTIRGLHYQLENAQAKLVQVIRGAVFDVAVDIRRGSPTFGRWTAVTLTDENRRQVLVPQGFAHGFCVLSDVADVIYKCTDLYAPHDERGILWSDPELAIDWPTSDPILSHKDSQLPPLSLVPRESLPVYEAGA